MAFQNRQAEHLNRKKLTVVSESTNSNGTKVLTVDVERADGNVSVPGTPLTAENLTAEIKALISQNTSAGLTAKTQCTCDYSTKIATTQFVWDVLTALGYTKINHSSSSSSGGSSSGGSSSGSSGT